MTSTGGRAEARALVGVMGVGHFGQALVRGLLGSGMAADDMALSPRGRSGGAGTDRLGPGQDRFAPSPLRAVAAGPRIA